MTEPLYDMQSHTFQDAAYVYHILIHVNHNNYMIFVLGSTRTSTQNPHKTPPTAHEHSLKAAQFRQ